MHHSPRGNRTFGEALIAAIALIGLVVFVDSGKITSMEDVWPYAAMLLLIVVFYAALLLVRAIFTFMTGGENFWWEKYEEDWKQHPIDRKKK